MDIDEDDNNVILGQICFTLDQLHSNADFFSLALGGITSDTV